MSLDRTPPPFRRSTLEPGLYLVATPIGAARDITLRALDILASAEILAAEDTRQTRHLMDIHGIPLGDRPLLSYHDRNGAARRPALLAALAEGRSVAYASDAGTPLISDPGYRLVLEATAAGHRVTAAPGPSAVLAALAVAGQPTDRFFFAGFAPSQAGQRRSWVESLAKVDATLVLFESPVRVNRLFVALCEGLGKERPASLCRELTKRFEEVRRGTLGSIAESIDRDPPRGEIVLVIGRGHDTSHDALEIDAALSLALEGSTVGAAASEVAAAFGLRRRDVYRRALALRQSDPGTEAAPGPTRGREPKDEGDI